MVCQLHIDSPCSRFHTSTHYMLYLTHVYGEGHHFLQLFQYLWPCPCIYMQMCLCNCLIMHADSALCCCSKLFSSHALPASDCTTKHPHILTLAITSQQDAQQVKQTCIHCTMVYGHSLHAAAERFAALYALSLDTHRREHIDPLYDYIYFLEDGFVQTADAVDRWDYHRSESPWCWG